MPLRVSVDPDDPAYSAHAFRARVTLDGTEVRDVVTADEAAGYVLRYRRGSLWFAKDASDSEVVVETGDVRIYIGGAR